MTGIASGYAIATPHNSATRIGADVLRSGGNAVDAAVAASIALGVVAPYDCGVGGDLFALIWDGTPRVYNGSGRAPAMLNAERIRESVDGDGMPLFGAHTVSVPGAVEGWFNVLERHGSRSFEELASPSAELAENGFELSKRAVNTIARAGEQNRGSAAWQSIYEPAMVRGWLRQPGLGALLGRLSTEGPSAFYGGEVARAVSDCVCEVGGVLTTDDLATHRGDWIEPLSCDLRGFSIHQSPPNSQGVVALQALAALEDWPLESMSERDRQVLLIDAARLAVAERNRRIADPDFMDLSAADLLVEHRILDLRQALGGPEPPEEMPSGPDLGQTAYLCCADRDGLLVSLIQSNFLGFGSGLTVPAWGINLHNRGSGFTLKPGHPNEAAGSKRPLHTLMPALVTRGGEPTHLLGTMGGTNQVAIHLQLLMRLLVDGDRPADALEAPRWALGEGHQVLVEQQLASLLGSVLAERGDVVDVGDGQAGAVGYAQALELTEPSAAADPRSEGSASVGT